MSATTSYITPAQSSSSPSIIFTTAATTTTMAASTPIMPVATSSKDTTTYHPMFASPDADVVLYSTDDVHYRIHSYVLSIASGFFRTMFTLPQPSTTTSTPTPLPVHETSEILTPVLSLITSKLTVPPVSEWPSMSFVRRVLLLAEMYDMPGPISYVRSALSTPALLEKDALMVYALASHYEWPELLDLASRWCLALPSDTFHSHPLEEDIELLASPSDLDRLMKLREKRYEDFASLINSPHGFSAGNTEGFMCTYCGVTVIDNSSWKTLKARLLDEMKERPLGDHITGTSIGGVAYKGEEGGMSTWEESQACWDAKCSRGNCSGLNYDKAVTLKQIMRCVDVLPLHL